MKPAPFAYHRPESVEETLALLAEHGYDANVLAGGQSLLPVLSMRVARPEHVIDVNGLGDLGHITKTNGTLELGALVRQRDAIESTLVSTHAPLVADALRYVGHPETRNRGTLGGSIAHNDPAAELGAVALACDGVVVLRSTRGERREPVTDFLVAPFLTSKAPDELVVRLELPVLAERWGWAFAEITRRHHDFAVLAVAAGIALDERGSIADARLAYAGAGGTALRARQAEALLRGGEPTPSLVAEASDGVPGELDPPSDPLASAAYRNHVATVLTRRALTTAVERAKGAR